jgi:glycosyltransferase involved in cell wall biosynthesis
MGERPVQRPEKISVIVSTYNNPRVLEMVLGSLAHQERGRRTPAYEVIVADDGSGEDTAALLARLQAGYPVPLLHAWQADRGFRVAAARNTALLMAGGDYVVFIDGDCLVPADFIAAHARLAEPAWFVAGARCFIKRRPTAAMMTNPDRWIRPRRLAWFGRGLRAAINRPFQLLSLPGNLLRYRRPGEWRKVQTCNLAVWRSDIDRIGGFDETYVGHGFEDSDFALRLIRAGVGRKSGRFGSVVLHLWHPRPGAGLSPNAGRFAALLQQTDRYLPAIGLGSLERQAPAA